MPNQRQAGKQNVGGYLDGEIKKAIQATGMDESSVVELALIRDLLNAGRITVKDLQRWATERRIRQTTILQLRHDKVLPVESRPPK